MLRRDSFKRHKMGQSMRLKSIIKTVCVSSLLLGSTAMAKNYVYALQGFLIQGEQPEWNSLVADVQDSIDKKKDQDIVFKSAHNTSWKDICEEIRQRPPATSGDKIILVGHSYGASSAVEIAKCVGPDIKIDLIVTIDSVKKFSFKNSNLIPENVEKNINIYQTQDLLLTGERNNHRSDGLYKKIENIEMKVSMPTLTPHNMILQELANRKSMSKILNSELKSRSVDPSPSATEQASHNTKPSDTGAIR